MISKAKSILTTIFGYTNFRPLQEEIISRILSKNDALVIMPTGGGKSLCYQIPSLLFEGLTIVVSPLISLMKDQVEQLRLLGVGAAVLNSSLSHEEYHENVSNIESGKSKLLYVAPETLLMERTINILRPLKIDCITIDEAHCISEWGHDFRPEYRELVKLREIFTNAVYAAFTATATPRVQEDIIRSLKLNNPKKYIASFDRQNLYLEIAQKYDALNQTIKFLRRYQNQSGIIYCFSRKQVDSLAAALTHHGFSVRPYHAGLPDDERKTNQELFIKDDVQIIVATIAFGMGINKSNVRFVIHYDLPKNIEGYYQEIGRSGRDGLRAHCLLLFNYSDIMKINYFIDQKEGEEKRIAKKHLQSLLNYAETGVCRRIPLLKYFGEKYENKKCGMCDNCNSAEKDLVDVTIPAQKFLSCIKRTGEIYGAGYIIDVLRGSKAQKIIDNKHDQISTYGIGNDYSKLQWIMLSHQFVKNELIIPEPQYGSLKVAPKGYDVLFNRQTVTGTIKEDAEQKRTVIDTADYDLELFNILKSKRKKIASASNLPPYVIFSDKSLIDMAGKYPINKKEMLSIYGMGEIKYERYGEIFLGLIIDYCRKYKKKEIENKPHKNYKQDVDKKPKMNVKIGEMYNSGKSVSEIMNVTKLKRSTILGHLYTYSQNAPLQNPARLLEDSFSSEEKITEASKAFSDLGTELLKPVYTALEEKISYDELHLIRIYYLNATRK